MKSDIIQVDNHGNGFEEALLETQRFAALCGLEETNALKIRKIADEMLSLVRSVTGELAASFWMEGEGKRIDLHMSTKARLDKEQRALLLSSSTTGKNEAAKGILGKLRAAIEQAAAAEPDHADNSLSSEVAMDVANYEFAPEWDGYERSELRRLADEVKISLKGGIIDMTVRKKFGE